MWFWLAVAAAPTLALLELTFGAKAAAAAAAAAGGEGGEDGEAAGGAGGTGKKGEGDPAAEVKKAYIKRTEPKEIRSIARMVRRAILRSSAQFLCNSLTVSVVSTGDDDAGGLAADHLRVLQHGGGGGGRRDGADAVRGAHRRDRHRPGRQKFQMYTPPCAILAQFSRNSPTRIPTSSWGS